MGVFRLEAENYIFKIGGIWYMDNKKFVIGVILILILMLGGTYAIWILR